MLARPLVSSHRSLAAQVPARGATRAAAEPPDRPAPPADAADAADAPTTTTTTTTAAQAAAAAARARAASPRKRTADSTDPIASALTRRFGLAGGLAWLGVLSAGVVGEQVKTRREGAAERAGTKDVAGGTPPVDLGGGVVAQDVRLGGGERPRPGLLAVVDLEAWAVAGGGPGPPASPVAAAAAAAAAGPPLFTTRETGKPLVLLVGARPLTGGLCPGAEAAMLGMRAGGKRVALVPSPAGFGAEGAVVRPTRHAPGKGGEVPPNTDLVYSIELVRVSVPPS